MELCCKIFYEVLCERFKSEGFVFSGNMRKGIKETIDLLKEEVVQVLLKTLI